ncbi:beta-fructofuranosidase, insoluble isoenzyme 7-like isoform X2 [Carex rostrata]
MARVRVIILHAILIQIIILSSKIEAVPSLLPLAEAYPQIQELCSELNKIDPDRTAFHFQPSKNWLNGPMYYKGLYHLFYQYNPQGPLWGTLVWGHSVSTDLVNWEALDVALDRTDPFDINGVWSGSVTFVAGEPIILYTGIDDKQRNVQNIAFRKNGSDPLLREWTKPGYNPIMLPGGDIDPDNFRDPTTGWFGQDRHWRTAVGANLEGRAEILLYKSQNFENWTRNEFPLHKSQNSGMWECPDFFPVSLSSKDGLDPSVNTGNIKHVLKVSLMKTLQDYYLVGKYDEKKDVFVPDEGYEDDYRTWPMIDYGHVYASKSFFDSKNNRRILWSWVNESDSEADDVKRGWSGMQTFPRAIWLDTDGMQLIQWPIEDIKLLRKQQIQLRDFGLQSGVKHEISGILTSQANVEVEFELPSLEGAESFDNSFLLDPSKLCDEITPFDEGGIGPFGLFVLTSDIEGEEEYTAIYFRIYKSSDRYMTLMCSDLKSSSRREGVYKPAHGAFVGVDISKDKIISLRTLIDHSVVESFVAGGRTCMTMRVYPKHVLTDETSGLYVFNYGSQEVKIRELNAWEMAKARVNIENDDFISRDYI